VHALKLGLGLEQQLEEHGGHTPGTGREKRHADTELEDTAPDYTAGMQDMVQ
jgi:hypothetical protein